MPKKYKAKHDYIKGLIPKPFLEIADSAVDHLGELINRVDPLEFFIGVYCAYMSSQAFLEPTPQFIAQNFLMGMLATRGVTTNSEVIGGASLIYLSGMGLLGIGLGQIKETQEKFKAADKAYEAGETTFEEHKQKIWELIASYQSP